MAILIQKDPMRLLLRQEELTVEGIKQMYVDCDSQEGRNAQYETLVRLYGLATIGQSIIFVRVSVLEGLVRFAIQLLTCNRRGQPQIKSR